ncbi:hypothetical protein AB0N16_18060 [Streptomyces sp. NPDC051105]|uniref:hypothetical protein n=1 Tax=Streptomyces sp. NPDC051105 TaxID=3154843 RepID=UPI0034485DC7
MSTLGELGWDQKTFVRKATGREPLDAAGTVRVERLGMRWLPLADASWGRLSPENGRSTSAPVTGHAVRPA